ncbi:hydroxyacylglutathione hydrolase [Fomitiporia mediterranea MF3/22]|uniref:hydroxyacylglutathione hydrolase n=1 Tax=Fomitiporia mediterranea (strain MF3/22) TaxID=694068 RepID=UPI00044074F4|nr:hydroxyacylglutathione hydrolase [Fomitiporia mediterranea MF3/22]EJD05748.1 hydroxyacylglutathione hydrolase [Fomitiporia mediterranea MF3/22]
MKVVPVPVRSDNYAYLLIDDSTNKAAVVDPFDMTKVQAAAAEQGVDLVANLTTHHHFDHSGGNKVFANLYPGKPIYGGSDQGAADHIVKDNDQFTISEQLDVKCLATPCHTQDSICFYVTDKANPTQPGAVFTGDTLFIAGCGRFFEGNATQMHRALSYLGTLPDQTVVYNGHEYTASNLAFAKSVEPNASGVARLQEIVNNNKVTTGKTTIGDEKEWNVFMRLSSSEILKSLGATADTPTESIMDALRTRKNNF